MLKFGSELRYGIRSPNVLTPVDIPTYLQEILGGGDSVLVNKKVGGILSGGDFVLHSSSLNIVYNLYTFLFLTLICLRPCQKLKDSFCHDMVQSYSFFLKVLGSWETKCPLKHNKDFRWPRVAEWLRVFISLPCLAI